MSGPPYERSAVQEVVRQKCYVTAPGEELRIAASDFRAGTETYSCNTDAEASPSDHCGADDGWSFAPVSSPLRFLAVTARPGVLGEATTRSSVRIDGGGFVVVADPDEAIVSLHITFESAAGARAESSVLVYFRANGKCEIREALSGSPAPSP